MAITPTAIAQAAAYQEWAESKKNGEDDSDALANAVQAALDAFLPPCFECGTKLSVFCPKCNV